MTITNIRWFYFWTPNSCGTEILYFRDGIPSCTRTLRELTEFNAIAAFLALIP